MAVDVPNIPGADTDLEGAYAKAFSPEATTVPMELPSSADAAQPQQPSISQAPAAAAGQQTVHVISPDGQLGSIPGEQLAHAMQVGYTQATDQQVAEAARREKYGSTLEQLKTGLEGAAEASTFGLSTGVESALFDNAKEQLERRETNPGVHMLGQAGGLGLGMLTGSGEAAVLGRLGEAAAAATGLAKPATALAKIGSAAVKGMIENAAFESGDEVSRMLIGDPSQHIDTAIADIGLSGLLGGVLGGAFGSVQPIWQATAGSEAGQFLQKLAKRAGGIEGETGSAAAAGVREKAAPEVQAYLSGDSTLGQMGKTLEQSDTTSSGKAFQAGLNSYRHEILPEATIEAAGSTPKRVAADFSKAEHGKSIGSTLADEVAEIIDPLAEQYEKKKVMFKDVELAKDQHVPGGVDYSNPYLDRRLPDTVIPGTTSQIAEQVVQLAQREGWTASPSSDIMKEVHRVLKELPAQRTLNDLSSYIKAIGDNMQSDPLNGPLKRAGSLIKNLFQDAEGEIITTHLGEKLGPEAVAEFAATKKAWADAAKIKEALDDRLHIKGSVSGYAKALRSFASTDAEHVFNRLSGTNDAQLFEVLEHFPKTSEAIRTAQIDKLLDASAKAAKGDAALNVDHFLKQIDALAPESRNFLFRDAEMLAKLKDIQSEVNQINKLPHNFPNTARTMDSLFEHVTTSAAGIGALLLGHNPIGALLAAGGMKLFGKTIPDAMRLGLLKFMGSNKPIDSAGFKAMIHMYEAAIKGQKLIEGGTKAVFDTGRTVLPAHLLPNDKNREKLDKRLQKLQADSSSMSGVGEHTSHYLPEHGVKLAETTARVTNYVNAQRPDTTPKAPLDPKPVISQERKAAFNQVLDIAQQPLIVLDKIKQGTLVPRDIVHLRNMYPSLYTKLSDKLTSEMVNHITDGETVPYATRMSLSLFLGQALDSTLTPSAIMAAQPVPKQAPPQQGQGAPKGRPSSPAVGKMSVAARTPLQTKELNRQKD